MAKVTFDMHPSAFLARISQAPRTFKVDPSLFKPKAAPAPKPSLTKRMMNFILQTVALIGFIWFGLFVWYLFTQTQFVPTVTVAVKNTSWYLQAVRLLSVVLRNKLYVIMMSLSWITGFGTFAFIYKLAGPSASVPTDRLRKGPCARKQACRLWKRCARNSRGHSTRCKPMNIPSLKIRKNLTHGERYNNIGRKHRKEPPNIERIKFIRIRMKQLYREITDLERLLIRKKREWARYDRELKELTRFDQELQEVE